MKKLLFSIAISLLAFNVSAQLIPGLKLGANMASFKSAEIETTNSKIGINVGGTIRAIVGSKFEIVSELMLTQKGGTIVGYDETFTTQKVEKDYSIISISWAVLGNIYIVEPNLSLQFGGVLGLVNIPNFDKTSSLYLTESNNFFAPQESYNRLTTSDMDEGINGLDYFITAGISGGSEAFRVNFRYNLGMKDYLKMAKEEKTEATEVIKQNYFQLSISYFFMNMRVQ